MCSFVFFVAQLSLAGAIDNLSPAECARARTELEDVLTACPRRRHADYTIQYAIIPQKKPLPEWEADG